MAGYISAQKKEILFGKRAGVFWNWLPRNTDTFCSCTVTAFNFDWLADGRFPSEQSLDDTASIEEERRVFHVAVTRAEEELYLLVPQQYRPRGGGLVFMKPSRFLSELDRELFETLELE